jgi:RimJ/RimL family protein N-acetyltransferase
VWTIVLASHSLLFPGLPLHSARLVLSPIRRDDAAALFTLQSNPDVMRWWNHPAWTRPAEAREQIDDDLAAHAIGTQLKLAVRESLEGPLLGICVVFAVDRDAARAEIGYLLAPDRQGQGYMHEALQQVLAYLFRTLHLHRVEAEIDPRNAPSARAGTPGLPPRGVLRQRWRIQGSWPTRPSTACWPMTTRQPPCPLDPIWPVAGSTHGHAFGHIRHGPPPA